jgi:hypothetical protein
VNRFVWVATAVLVLGLGASVQPRASAQEELSRGWRASAGVFMPSKSTTRSIGGDVWYVLGFEHPFWAQNRTVATLGVDYYAGTHLHAIPILLNVTQETGRIHYGAGIGYAIQQATTGSVNSLGYKVFAGIDIRQNPTQHPTYIDLTWRGSAQTHGDLDGIQISLSYLF